MKQERSLPRLAWNIIALNIGWFACVLGAAWNIHLLGVGIVSALFVIHIIIIENESIGPAMLLAAASLAAGLIADTALIAAGVYEPARWIIPAPLPTVWLFMLWINFSLALNESLRWLQDHLFAAAALGAFFGPSAYVAANKLGAVSLPLAPVTGIGLLVLAWAAALPAVSLTARFLYRLRKR